MTTDKDKVHWKYEGQTRNRRRWLENCTELYNCKLKADTNVLKNEDQLENRETREVQILKEEKREKGGQILQNDKLPGVKNIPVEVFMHGGPRIIDVVTVVYQKYGPVDSGPITEHSQWLFLFLKNATHDFARTTERSAWLVAQARSCYE